MHRALGAALCVFAPGQPVAVATSPESCLSPASFGKADVLVVDEQLVGHASSALSSLHPAKDLLSSGSELNTKQINIPQVTGQRVCNVLMGK